jgi:hypothetical protein
MSITRSIADLPAATAANTRHTMNGESLKPARRLVLEEHTEGTYVFRYADDWSLGGDTWHANIHDALAQIEFEYEVGTLDWKPISEEALTVLTNPK